MFTIITLFLELTICLINSDFASAGWKKRHCQENYLLLLYTLTISLIFSICSLKSSTSACPKWCRICLILTDSVSVNALVIDTRVTVFRNGFVGFLAVESMIAPDQVWHWCCKYECLRARRNWFAHTQAGEMRAGRLPERQDSGPWCTLYTAGTKSWQ